MQQIMIKTQAIIRPRPLHPTGATSPAHCLCGNVASSSLLPPTSSAFTRHDHASPPQVVLLCICDGRAALGGQNEPAAGGRGERGNVPGLRVFGSGCVVSRSARLASGELTAVLVGGHSATFAALMSLVLSE